MEKSVKYFGTEGVHFHGHRNTRLVARAKCISANTFCNLLQYIYLNQRHLFYCFVIFLTVNGNFQNRFRKVIRGVLLS